MRIGIGIRIKIRIKIRIRIKKQRTWAVQTGHYPHLEKILGHWLRTYICSVDVRLPECVGSRG